MKTALSPASNAGLMSDFGLLPTIHVCRAASSLLHQPAVRGRVLLIHDGGVIEETAQAGAIDLQLLLFGMALGEQRQVVARGQILQRLRHALDDLHGTFQNALRKAHHGRQIVLAHVPLGQVVVALRRLRPKFSEP